MLRDLFVSKVRVKLLQTFLAQPNELFYVRQLVKILEEEINAVRRELGNLENIGLVKKEPRGNRLYYWINQHHPFYEDLLSLMSKTMGLGGEIVKNKSKVGEIKYAMLSGRFARGLATKEGGVDLLLVGDLDMNKLSEIVKGEEKKINREVNYTTMTRDELVFRKQRRDPFLLAILAGSRIMLVGDEEDLVSGA